MLVGYARVSTNQQRLDLQINALQDSGCEKIFTESASGSKRDRPELKEALAYLRPGDTLVVWKLDRLARNLKQLLETVEDLNDRQIGFRSLTESMDTTTAGGSLIFSIFGALGAFERSIIQERTKAGLEAARLKGKLGGRPRKLSDSDIVAAKAMLASEDLTVAQVAKHLGVSVPTLYRHIPRPKTP